MVLTALPNTITDTQVNAAAPTTTEFAIAQLLGLSALWADEQRIMGLRVARCRRYYDGDHDMKLNKQMRELLQVKDNDDGLAINLMPSVVDTAADRCIVQRIEGVEDTQPDRTEQSQIGTPSTSPSPAKSVNNAITEWAQETADNNNFDVIQGELHVATWRDGNCYLMTAWNNEKKQAEYTIEPAWDGQSGMLMVYRSRDLNKPYAAVKIWQIDNMAADGASVQITTRMNAYFEDRLEKYIADAGGAFHPFIEDGQNSNVYKWDMVNGAPIGIPIVHFRNGGRNNYGVSELRNAIPVQNALNRFHYSGVVAAELTAFAIYVELGFERDSSAVTPGMTVKIPGPVTNDMQVDFKKLEGSDIGSILNMIDNERRLIGEITRTPTPELSAHSSGSNKSGEYLKQLEVGLIGKVRRFTTRAGSSWEQVFDMAWKVQQAYGTIKPPPYKRFICLWKSPEIRNNAEVVQNAMAVQEIMGEKQTLRNVAEVFDLDEQAIEDIQAEKTSANDNRVAGILANIPTFGSQRSIPPAMPTQPGAMPMAGGAMNTQMQRMMNANSGNMAVMP